MLNGLLPDAICRRGVPYTRDEVATAVAVLPAIEVGSSRFRDPLGLAAAGAARGLRHQSAGWCSGQNSPTGLHLDLPRLHVTAAGERRTCAGASGRPPQQRSAWPCGFAGRHAAVAGGGVEAGAGLSSPAVAPTGCRFLETPVTGPHRPLRGPRRGPKSRLKRLSPTAVLAAAIAKP